MKSKEKLVSYGKSSSKKPAAEEKKEKPRTEEILKLARRIKELRIKKGYSNYEFFAYENNISRTQYGRYEMGEDIRYSSLVKIVKAFGMTMSEFFSEGFDD